jgi:hypothetical protein
MTPRQGLWMALVGLVVGILCGLVIAAVAVTLGPSDLKEMAMILLFVGGFAGHVVMIFGLIVAGVGALTKQTR